MRTAKIDPIAKKSLSRFALVVSFASIFTSFLAAPAQLRGGDWPQILGPNRDGHAVDEKLHPEWPASGPKKLWTRDLGMGYAGAAVQGDRVVVFHRLGDQERLEAFDLDGKPKWRADFAANYGGGYNSDTGPRSTPVIHGDRVIAYGADGDLHCVALEDGKKLWSRALLEDFSAPQSYFGAGSSPIVLKDRVFVNLGARGAGLVCLQLKDGKTVWAKSAEGASYSSPIVLPLAGKNRLFFITRYNGVCIDPATGSVVFEFPFGKRGPTVNAATPIFSESKLFLSSSYGVGARVYQVNAEKPKLLWGDDETMSSQYATAVAVDGNLYGCDGREDIGVASFCCVDAATGEVRWRESGVGVAHVIRSKDLLLLQTNEGRILLLRVNPEKYELLGQFQAANGATRAIPALSQGRLFIRENNGSTGSLICLRVGD